MITNEQIRIQAESEYLYRKACELYYLEDYERAMESLEEAVRLSPNFSSALCVMGHSLCNGALQRKAGPG